MKVLLVLLLAVDAFAGRLTFNSRIVGGTDAPDGAYPYQVSLRRDKKHSCGGSIINEKNILSAAHCVYLKYEKKDVVVGSNKLNEGGVWHKVYMTYPHNGYISLTSRYDIALIKLETPIVYNDVVQPIAWESSHVTENIECVLTGWGYTEYPSTNDPNNMQQITLRTISNEQCENDLSPSTIYSSNICTYTKEGEGACKGDSGGPLVSVETNTQIGIVSWGRPCGIGKPDVFTRVSSFNDWILEKAK